MRPLPDTISPLVVPRLGFSAVGYQGIYHLQDLDEPWLQGLGVLYGERSLEPPVGFHYAWLPELTADNLHELVALWQNLSIFKIRAQTTERIPVRVDSFGPRLEMLRLPAARGTRWASRMASGDVILHD